MFGLLLSGRLVDTNFRQVDASHVVIDVDDVSGAGHVVVFLTGQQPFPDGMGGAVYFSWPVVATSADVGGGTPQWNYLGHLSNAKPSAIFKIIRPKKDSAANNNGDSTPSSADLVARFGGLTSSSPQPQLQPPQLQPSKAQLGISMEPLTQLAGMAPDGGGGADAHAAANVSSFVEFAQKMVDSLFNYTSSFALTPDQLAAQLQGQQLRPGETLVPFSTLRTWYANFERRLQQNPNFWKS